MARQEEEWVNEVKINAASKTYISSLDCYLNSIKKSIEDPEVYVRKIAEKEKRISWHLYVMLMIG